MPVSSYTLQLTNKNKYKINSEIPHKFKTEKVFILYKIYSSFVEENFFLQNLSIRAVL